MNERRDDDGVDGELQIDQPAMILGKAERRQIDDAQAVGQANEKEERVNGKRSGAAQLNEHRPSQQQRTGNDADGDQREQTRTQVHPVILLIKSKIGMYIAMTMPPTTPPRSAIMIGSSSVSSPATATSTSSS